MLPTWELDPDETATTVLNTHQFPVTLDMFTITLATVVGSLVTVHGADPILGNQGRVLELLDQSPFATITTLDIRPCVHDALKFILLQLSDLLNSCCLFFTIF